MMTLLLALLIQDPAAASGVPTDKDAEAAVKALKEAYAAGTDDEKVAAVREALQVRHEKVIKAVGEVLTTGPQKVRIAAALALGESDHPAAVDALTAALAPNQSTPIVLAALAAGLGALRWEASAPKLVEYLKRVGDAEVREAVPEILAALGQIGSVSSVDPIIDLLRKLQGPRRDPWPNEGEISRACQSALRAITGGEESKANDWDAWWKANKGGLLAGAKTTWWLKKTQERVELGAAEKAPADSIKVGTRVVEAPAAKGEGRKKKKGN